MGRRKKNLALRSRVEGLLVDVPLCVLPPELRETLLQAAEQADENGKFDDGYRVYQIDLDALERLAGDR